MALIPHILCAVNVLNVSKENRKIRLQKPLLIHWQTNY